MTSGLSFFSGATGGVSDCDSVTDWTGAPTLDTEIYLQGTGALSAKVSKKTYTAMFTLASALDLSDTQLFVWMMCATIGVLDTKANGGIRIRVEDGAGNWGEWYVAGKDTWGGSWECFMVHTTTAFDSQSATAPDKTAITAVGVVCTTTASVAKTNFWWDALRYGVGLYIKGGTEADPATFADFVAAEKDISNMWGVITEVEGVVMAQSKLYLGSTTEGEATYFKDESKILVFRDRAVPNGFYDMIVQGNATATTKVYFGTEVGGKGISGCIFKSAGAAKFNFTATDPNITDLGIYGCIFLDAGTVSLPAYSTTRKVLSTTFEACGEVLADTCMVQFCNFVNADLRGVRIDSTDHNITYSNFIGCPRAVNITVDGTVTITFTGLKFSGNEYDVEKSSPTGDLTIQNTEGSDASTYIITGGGTVTIVTAVTLTIRKVKTGNEPAEYVRCAIYRKSDMLELMNMDATVDDDLNPGYYKASTSTSLFGFAVIVRAREKGWLPFETEVYLTSEGLDITAIWLEDPNYMV